MLEAGHTSPREHVDVRSIGVSLLDGNLLDAFVRLARLLEAPADALFLMPLITREIIYRLLMGGQGGTSSPDDLGELHSFHRQNGQATPPRRATSPCASSSSRELGMSVSRLHHHREGRHGAESLACAHLLLITIPMSKLSN